MARQTRMRGEKREGRRERGKTERERERRREVETDIPAYCQQDHHQKFDN